MLMGEFAMETLELQHNLLGSLCLLVEDRFSLTSEALLFSKYSTKKKYVNVRIDTKKYVRKNNKEIAYLS
jgi:hypothetical protein